MGRTAGRLSRIGVLAGGLIALAALSAVAVATGLVAQPLKAGAFEAPHDRHDLIQPVGSEGRPIAENDPFLWHRWAEAVGSCDASCTWDHTFGAATDDKIAAAVQLADGGFAIVGNTRMTRTGGYNAWVLRVAADGRPIWRESFGGGATDQLRDLIETPDGRLYAVGHTRSRGAGQSDLWLLKLDADGTVLFQRTYGGAANDRVHAAVPTGDGGIVVTGFTASQGAGGRDLWVARFSAAGQPVWSRTLGGADHDEGFDLVALPDGGLAVTGHFWAGQARGYDTAVARFTADGDVLWQRSLDRAVFDAGTGLAPAPDGGLLVVGATSDAGQRDTDLLAIRLDADGQTLWERTYGGSGGEEPWDVTASALGGFVVAVETFSQGEGGDIWLLGLAPDGEIAWQRLFGGTLWDHPSALIETADGGLVLGGHTASKGAGLEDGWLLRLTADGRL